VDSEPLSPELVLVDPDLAARARAALPAPTLDLVRPLSQPPSQRPVSASAPAPVTKHPYPMWARATAAMWLVVLGILIGGAAIPHAQDTPHLIPQSAQPTVCKRPVPTPKPVLPGPGIRGRPGQ
jgi:hypothetical protein